MGRNYSTKTTDSGKDTAELYLNRTIKAELLDLPFAAFARCVCDLLEAEGYTQVQLAGRASYRGRNKEGGYDIEAYLPSPLSQKQATGNGVLRRKVIVQVKQFPENIKIYQRNMDELRGACLRTGAIEAVLVTTSDFSPLVRNSESALRREAGSGSVAPVHLINGDALAERLITHRIGVQIGVHSGEANGGLALDPTYFARLREAARKETASSSASATSNPGNSLAGDRVVSTSDSSKLPKQGVLHARMSRTKTEITLTLPITLFDTLAGHGKSSGESSAGKGGA